MSIAWIIGGVGLFLLGMSLMTDGLKSLAGDRLRVVLSSMTGRPVRAFVSGAGLTVAVQSSSATSLATIGMVSAGLLSFPQAVGVIIGAAVGTTSTGWIVSLLGLKFSIASVAMPMVGIGVLVKLFTRDRRAAVGMAIAGFGLIFVGIDTLKTAMESASAHMNPASLPGGTAWGDVALVGIGVAMTVVMQSSSAAVAMTMAALHAGTITLEQGVSLVVGANVGTTVTPMLAAIGATTAAKRTAAAHVVFNTASSAIGLAAIPAFLWIVGAVTPDADRSVVSLAAFHTGFTLVGALVFLPFVRRYAGLIARLVRDRDGALTINLDDTVASVPAVAVDAARRATMEAGAILAEAVRETAAVGAVSAQTRRGVEEVDGALDRVRSFLARVRTDSNASEHAAHIGVLHAIDHFERLIEGLGERELAARVRRSGAELGDQAARLAESAARVRDAMHRGRGDADAEAATEAGEASSAIASYRRAQRVRVLQRTASGDVPPDDALDVLEAARWLDRLGYHLWRGTVHLLAPAQAGGAPERHRVFAEPERHPGDSGQWKVDTGHREGTESSQG